MVCFCKQYLNFGQLVFVNILIVPTVSATRKLGTIKKCADTFLKLVSSFYVNSYQAEWAIYFRVITYFSFFMGQKLNFGQLVFVNNFEGISADLICNVEDTLVIPFIHN